MYKIMKLTTLSLGCLLALLSSPSAQSLMSDRSSQLTQLSSNNLHAQYRDVIEEQRRRRREEEAWDRDPRNPLNQDPEIRRMDNFERIVFYNARGLAYHRAKDFARAISYYDKAIQTCLSITAGYSILPHCANPYNNRGLSKELSSDFTGAMADYNEAIRIDKNANKYHNRAMLKRDLRDFVGALDDANAAISMESKAEYYDTRAQVKQKLNDLSGAVQDYRKAAQMYRQAGDNEGYQAVVKDLRAMNATP
jgi:tetratricopeptide (TPR) repeat protein